MAFTYFTDTDNPEARDFVRFRIQDTVENSGPLPGDANFSDEVLDAIILEEGTWQRAVAACYEALAAAWTPNPSWQADGLSVSQSHIGRNYADLADKWRKKYGGHRGAWSFSRTVIRVDGYSDDVASNEVDN